MATDERFDFRQWRALLVAGLRHDLRSSGRAIGLANASGGTAPITLLVLQAVLGLFISMPAWASGNVYGSTVLHLTYLMLSIGSVLVLDAEMLIVAAAERAVVAPRPVAPSTAFAARAARVLAYLSVIAAAQSVAPLAAQFFAGGWHPLRGLFGLVAAMSVTLTTPALVVGLYALVIRRLSGRVLRVVMTVTQLALTFMVYGLLMVLPSRFGQAYLIAPEADRPLWLSLVPTTWAAALVEAGPAGWWQAVIALVVPVAAWAAVIRWLAPPPAHDTVVARATPARAAVGIHWFRHPETRAVALLARAQFRDDFRFRLTVLAIVPLTVLYMLMGMADGGGGQRGLVFLAVLIAPALLHAAFVRSDAYQAAWVFYASPVSVGRLLLGLRTVVASWFLLPYVAAVTAALSYLTGEVMATIVAVWTTALLSHALLLVTLLMNPALPFSVPPQVVGNSRSVAVAIVPAVLIGQLLPYVVDWPVLAVAGVIVVLVGINAGLHAWLAWRVERLVATAEFTGS